MMLGAIAGAGLTVLVAGSGVCTCPGPYPTVESLIATRPDVVIFVARVASILAATKGAPTVTRFAVEEVIRGVVPPEVEMTGITVQDEPCGVDLRVGELRTVAAVRGEEGGWSTSNCLMPRP